MLSGGLTIIGMLAIYTIEGPAASCRNYDVRLQPSLQ